MSFWDERYGTGWAYGVEPNDFLRSVVDRLPAGRALCLAEGQGRNAVFLATRGWDVTAVDQSAVGLARARELADARGVRIATVVGDLADFDLGTDAWDVVVSIWAHTPPAVRHRLHRAMSAALRPGGAFVLEAYRPEQIPLGTGGPKSADLLPTLDELRADLDLRLDHAVAVERDVREGEAHGGHSAVVQILGFRKS